ncbi:MAG TPA: hypothetical protein IAC40_00845 [Candidatus Faecivivens stercorigallinarum]|nr:hypothetical protein [Candidatus Faecivivens stercorigallinarum]
MALFQKKKQEPVTGVQLHNSPKELAVTLLKTLCICNVICVVVVFSMGGIMAQGTWGILLTALICLLIAGGTLYSQSWGIGDKDANLIQFGRTEYDRYKPLKMGLLALAPGLVSDVLLLFSKITGLVDLLWVYRLMNAPVWPLINLIHPYSIAPQEAMPEMILMEGTEYEEIVQATAATPGCSWPKLILMLLLPLIYIVFIWVGYELGRRRISISNRLVYENKHAKKSTKK